MDAEQPQTNPAASTDSADTGDADDTEPTLRYHLTVQTPHGEESVAFGPNHHIGAVLGEVLARIGYGTLMLDFQLVTAAGDPLDHTHTLGASEVNDEDTLTLDVNPVGGV